MTEKSDTRNKMLWFSEENFHWCMDYLANNGLSGENTVNWPRADVLGGHPGGNIAEDS